MDVGGMVRRSAPRIEIPQIKNERCVRDCKMEGKRTYAAVGRPDDGMGDAVLMRGQWGGGAGLVGGAVLKNVRVGVEWYAQSG